MPVEPSPERKKQLEEALFKMAHMMGDKTSSRERREQTDALMAERRKKREAEEAEWVKKNAPNLPEMEKRHAEMRDKYKKLGGSNWQYADREQNLTDSERQARSMEREMNDLGRQIQQIKNAGYKKGGKISLKDCSVSTAQKSKKSSGW